MEVSLIKKDLGTRFESVVSKNLCYACGVCASICPNDAIILQKIDNDVSHAIIDLRKCVHCGTCRNVCPINGWENIHFLNEASEEEIRLCLEPYQELGFGYSKYPKIRIGGASGGMVTAILCYLIENDKIDGVILPKPTGILNYKYEIISSVKDLKNTQKSIYFQVPLEIKTTELKKYNSLAFVGLPCHIEGIKRIINCDPDLEKRITYKIGLLCSANNYKYLFSFIIKKEGLNMEDIQEFTFRRGPWWDANYFSISSKNKSKTFPLRKGLLYALIGARLFSRDACLMCPDFTGCSADISFGDGWHPKFRGNKAGYNFYIVRNEKSRRLFEELKINNVVECIKSSPEEFCQSYLLHPLIFKHGGVKERAGLLDSIGHNTPKYIPNDKTFRGRLRSFAQYYGKKLFFFMYKKNILAYMPIFSIILFGYFIIFLSRKKNTFRMRFRK